MNKLCPTIIANLTRIPNILPTTKKSVILVVDCIYIAESELNNPRNKTHNGNFVISVTKTIPANLP